MSKKITFIGVGNMATAILLGITSRECDATPWSDIILFDTHAEKVEHFVTLGARSAGSLKEAVEAADIVFLCVKPQSFPDVMPQLTKCTDVSNKVFVTIAAGIPISTVAEATLGAPVIRAMPNTPMLIGKGVIALCRNECVTDEYFAFVRKIFESSGMVLEIKEDEMNRIICVTGSSPAYVFLLIKAMLDGAVAQGLLSDGHGNGLSEKDLINGICDTIIGTAELMKAYDKTPGEQIATVASKGGTTERALAELERYHFCEGIESAMLKCTERADELGNKKE